VRAALASAAFRIDSATPRLDAELLMAHALGVARDVLLLGRLDDAVPAAFDPLLRRRIAGEPVAYITGVRDLWTISLAVAPGVLIPRADSETLIEAAVAHFADRAPKRVLDLGTGSGALLLAALDQWPEASGIGVDASPVALDIARGNAGRLGMAARAEFRLGDWAEGIDERFDLVLCNPPYVEDSAELPREVGMYEPASALFAGPDGLDDYRRLAPQTARLIAPGGMAAFEIGAAQGVSVSALFAEQGLDARVQKDLAGRDRCVAINRR
jgi:release factor glutamine methyltransferase